MHLSGYHLSWSIVGYPRWRHWLAVSTVAEVTLPVKTQKTVWKLKFTGYERLWKWMSHFIFKLRMVIYTSRFVDALSHILDMHNNIAGMQFVCPIHVRKGKVGCSGEGTACTSFVVVLIMPNWGFWQLFWKVWLGVTMTSCDDDLDKGSTHTHRMCMKSTNNEPTTLHLIKHCIVTSHPKSTLY